MQLWDLTSEELFEVKKISYMSAPSTSLETGVRSCFAIRYSSRGFPMGIKQIGIDIAREFCYIMIIKFIRDIIFN